MRLNGENIKLLTINIPKIQTEMRKLGNNSYRYGYINQNMDYTNQPVVLEDNYKVINRKDRWSYNTQDIIYLTQDELLKENSVKEFYNNINSKKANITKDDIIYFSKSSSYPRHRLANFTENKRTIKKDKADYIVIPNDGFSFVKEPETFYKDIISGNFYKLDESRNYYENDEFLRFLHKYHARFPYDKHKVTRKGFLLGWAKMVLNLELQEVDLFKFITNNNYAKEDLIDLYDNYAKKVITEKQLDAYINSLDTTMSLDREKFDMINNMLKAKDATSTSLGLRMMNSFDSDKSLIPLALLLLFNIQNITRNKEWNTVGIKVLRKKLQFINQYNINSTRSQIYALNKLTKEFVKTNEDREMIREYGMPMIKGVVQNFIDSELKGIDFINNFDLILD